MNYYTEILRELREDRGLKQSDIANLIGTTQQQYSKYETEESELPLHAFITLADYYDLSADYLIGRTQCREGVDILNKEFIKNYSLGKFMSEVNSLGDKERRFIIESVELLKIKEGRKKMKE